jgi:hypothetical protein
MKKRTILRRPITRCALAADVAAAPGSVQQHADGRHPLRVLSPGAPARPLPGQEPAAQHRPRRPACAAAPLQIAFVTAVVAAAAAAATAVAITVITVTKGQVHHRL